MGLFDSLFSRKSHNETDEAFAKVLAIIRDEHVQLQMLNPAVREMISQQPSVDRIDKAVGEFGFVATNPIPVNGPAGEVAYLSKLETEDGLRILFHRTGSTEPAEPEHPVDIYEAVTFDGSRWFTLYLDMYHPRQSRLAPKGFRFFAGLAQFSGFNVYCVDFPYDFLRTKETLQPVDMALACIPYSMIEKQISNRAFRRPADDRSSEELAAAAADQLLAARQLHAASQPIRDIERALERATELGERSDSSDGLATAATAQFDLAVLFAGDGRSFAEIEEAYERAAALGEGAGTELGFATAANAQHNLANEMTDEASRPLDEIERVHRRAASLYERSGTSDGLVRAAVHQGLSAVFMLMQQRPIDDIERALNFSTSLGVRAGIPDGLSVAANAQNSLGDLLAQNGRSQEEVERSYTQAILLGEQAGNSEGLGISAKARNSLSGGPPPAAS